MTAASAPRAEGDLRNYALVTAAYWADTIADGAIRLLVLFYFYEQGYTPFQLATVFAFYEVFGIVTNLVGGFRAARRLAARHDPVRRRRGGVCGRPGRHLRDRKLRNRESKP